MRAPPKSVFQLLIDPTVIEEFTKWRVDAEEEIGAGTEWTERRLLRKRSWAVTAFDRRGLSFTQSDGTVSVRFAAKKGGPGSCNVQMVVEGPEAAVEKFLKSDGDRLDRMRDWLESD